MPADGAPMQERLPYLQENGMSVEFIQQIPGVAGNIIVNGILNDEARVGHVQAGHVMRDDPTAENYTYYVQYNASKGWGV